MTPEDLLLAGEMLLACGLTPEEAGPRLKAAYDRGWSVQDVEAWAALAINHDNPSRFLRNCLDAGIAPHAELKAGCGLTLEVSR